MQSVKLTRLALTLAQAGYAALQYDAAGCGDSPGLARHATLTGRVDELLDAADLLGRRFPGLPVAYMGSSLGGTAALVAADRRTPLCTICWSAPTDLDALFQRLNRKDPRPDLPDMVHDIPRHDLEAVLARTSRVLFVHGEEDEVVPVGQAHRGHELAREPKDLLVLPGADHSLSSLEDQARATAQSLAWLERFASGRE